MRGMKFAWSLLAATGVAGAAGAASANAVTVTENIAFGTQSQDISLAGATEYNYSTKSDSWTISDLNAYGNNQIGGWSTTPSLSASGQTFSNSSVKVASNFFGPSGSVGEYLHLQFEGAGGVEYLGYAAFDTAGDLTSITYAPAAAVPEPESWALLIAGVGLTGAAMRRRRRGAVAAVAA
jgi:hypothetical protein